MKMSFYLFELLLLKMCRVIWGGSVWMGFLRWGERLKVIVCFVWFAMCSWTYDAGVAIPQVAVAILKLGAGYFGVS